MNYRRALLTTGSLWLCCGAVLLAFLWHISVGAKAIPLATVWQALVAPEAGVFDHIIVRDLRLPRAIFAVTVGVALAVAGAVMQGVTRNPLAEPGILGLLYGATFAVMIGIGWFGFAGTAYVPLFAAVGALAGAVMVWGIAEAAPGGSTPLTLVLSGAAITSFLGAIQGAAILLNEEAFQNFRVWLSGSLAGRDMTTYLWALPWIGAGLLASLLIARQITALAMGEETAAGLGVDTTRIKTIALVSVVTLTAGAVAIAGPLGFVGLVIPHVVRLFVGADYRLIVPFSAIVGGGYVIVVDIAARMVLAPVEISTGVVTAMMGAPIFVWLVRSKL